MADVAELMVKIGGDASGLESALKGAQGAVEGVASGMKSVGVGLTAAVTVPLVALGAAAMKASADVGGAYRSMQRETGATGTELAGLKTAFDTVFKTVPASADDVATALSRITQTLDLTTKATGELATQFLNLSRMTGTDITTNIDSASEAFNAWGEAIPDTGFALDAFYTISQNTGQSVSDITSTLALAAGPAKAAGLGYQETAIMVAQLGAAGVPTKQIVSSLTAVVKDATTNNVSASTEWQNLINKFKDPSYKATADDMAILGTNTEKFANAARNGDLDFAPLLQKIKDSPNAINDMAAKTGTLTEALTLLKNRAELALKPLGDSIYGVAKDIVKSVDPIMTVVENLGKAFDKLPEPVKKAAVVIGAIGASMGPVITMGASVAQIVGTVGPAFVSATAGMAPMLIPLAAIGIALGALAIGLGIAYTASATFRGVLGTLTTAFTTFGGSVMKAITQLTGGDFSGALDTLRTALNQLVVDLSTINWSSVGEKIRTEIANAFSDKSSTLNTIADQIHKMIDAVPWAQLGQELGQAMGEMLSIGFGALTGTGGTGENPISASLVSATSTSASGSGGGGGFAGLKEAGKTAAGSFIGGFIEGLKEGMANINWGDVVGALWDGLRNIGPKLGPGIQPGGGGDNSDAMREWILKQLPSWDTIRDAIGKWWDDLVTQVGTWWDTIDWGNLFGGGKKSTGKGAAMIDIPAKVSMVIDFLVGVGKAIYDFIMGGAGKILSATINFLAGAGKAIYDFIMGGVSKVVSATVNFLKGAGQEIWNAFTTAASKIITITLQTIDKGWQAAKTLFGTIIDKVVTLTKNAVGTAWDTAKTLIGSIIDKIVTLTQAAIDNGWQAAKTLIGEIIDKIVTLTMNAIDNGISAAKGLWDSIFNKTVTLTTVTANIPAGQATMDSALNTSAQAEGGIVKAAGGFVTNGPTLVLAGDNPGGAEAFVPLQGGKIPVTLNASGGGGGSSNVAKDIAYLQPIHDATARSLNYAIVTTQNTGVANQHLNNITAVGQATTDACSDTAAACNATAASSANSSTTATDSNTAAIASSCNSMANSAASTASSCGATASSCGSAASSCAATAGSSAATAGSCASTAGSSSACAQAANTTAAATTTTAAATTTTAAATQKTAAVVSSSTPNASLSVISAMSTSAKPFAANTAASTATTRVPVEGYSNVGSIMGKTSYESGQANEGVWQAMQDPSNPNCPLCKVYKKIADDARSYQLVAKQIDNTNKTTATTLTGIYQTALTQLGSTNGINATFTATDAASLQGNAFLTSLGVHLDDRGNLVNAQGIVIGNINDNISANQIAVAAQMAQIQAVQQQITAAASAGATAVNAAAAAAGYSGAVAGATIGNDFGSAAWAAQTQAYQAQGIPEGQAWQLAINPAATFGSGWAGPTPAHGGGIAGIASFHEGGNFGGLKNDEILSVLQKGERIFSRDDNAKLESVIHSLVGPGSTQHGDDSDRRWRDDDRRWKDDDRKWKHDHEKHHRHGNNYIHVEGVKAEEIAREIARQQRIRDIMML
jgi:phage-related minor tail protein